MPDGSNGPSLGSTVSSETTGLVPNQLAVLVPTFDPAKDDVMVYSQKVQLLIQAWPDGRWTELATRLILGCSGSAFTKLQIHQQEVTQNDRKSIEKIITILGGQWGQINLEKQYEYAERAIYRCYQRSDENADSYLARADILWSELKAKDVTLDDLQPYVTLRGSQLSSEDKKKVLIDVDAANTGKLTIAKVSSAIRMLGASFFHDMTGQRKTKGKTYDQSTMVMDDVEMDDSSQQVFAAEASDPLNEEDAMDILVQEGDEDATLVADFEDSIQELVQGDEELAATYTAYTEARKRLSDKFKSRGFWPSSSGQKGGKSKSGFKGVKGKFGKGNSSSYSGRKSLQQRILESRCRLCNRIGHWKAECPMRSDSASNVSRSTGAPTSYTQAENSGSVNSLPLEFLHLPESLPTIDVTLSQLSAECFSLVTSSSQGFDNGVGNRLGSNRNNNLSPRDRIRNYLKHLKGCQPVIPLPVRTDEREEPHPKPNHHRSLNPEVSERSDQSAVSCFASHGSLGVVDLGATKTVIGSRNLKELIDSLHPEIRKSLYRCECKITFRFGNHGILKSEQALVIPIHGFHLKVAIVQGSTPFLLSNTLLRALGAVIDTSKKELFASNIQKVIPLHLTDKGLFLLDLNDLASVKAGQTVDEPFAETHNVMEPKEEEPSMSRQEEHDVPPEVSSDKAISCTTHSEKSQHTDITPENIQDCSNTVLHTATEKDQSRKSFAQSFSSLRRSSHHVHFGEETPKGASVSRGESSRCDQVLDLGARGDGRGLRPETPRLQVQGGMEPGSRLDRLVCESLPGLKEGQSLPFSPLRGADGGESRINRTEGASGDTQGNSPQGWNGCWEVLPQAQGSAQSLRGSKCHGPIRGSHDSRPDGGARGGVGAERSNVRVHSGGRAGIEHACGPSGNWKVACCTWRTPSPR